jgi:hypothetical protein
MKSVRQDSKDPISFRLILDFDEATLTAASCAIHSPGGSELRADSAVDVTRSVGLATLTPSAGWGSATYPVDRSFRVRWTLSVGSAVYVRDDYFDVTLRDFVSEVTDADIFRIESSAQAKLGSGGTLKDLRREAWGEIAQELAAALRENPAITASGSQFRLCHIYLVLAMFYRRERFGTLGAESEAAIKADLYEKEYRRALSRTMNNLNTTDRDDNEVGFGQEAQPWRRVRFLK